MIKREQYVNILGDRSSIVIDKEDPLKSLEQYLKDIKFYDISGKEIIVLNIARRFIEFYEDQWDFFSHPAYKLLTKHIGGYYMRLVNLWILLSCNFGPDNLIQFYKQLIEPYIEQLEKIDKFSINNIKERVNHAQHLVRNQ